MKTYVKITFTILSKFVDKYKSFYSRTVCTVLFFLIKPNVITYLFGPFFFLSIILQTIPGNKYIYFPTQFSATTFDNYQSNRDF